MGEVTPWMNITECAQRTGMQPWQDIVYTELLDPPTMRPLPCGATGPPVYTQLERRGQPMIRLVSGDQAEWNRRSVSVRRAPIRLSRAGSSAASDDMLVVRGRTSTQVRSKTCCTVSGELGTEFEIVVSRPNALDVLTVAPSSSCRATKRAALPPRCLAQTLARDPRRDRLRPGRRARAHRPQVASRSRRADEELSRARWNGTSAGRDAVTQFTESLRRGEIAAVICTTAIVANISQVG
jgi:hypothetical protein